MDSAGGMFQGSALVVVKILVLIFIIYCLYSLYKWLNGSTDLKDYLLYSSTNSGLPGRSDKLTTFDSTNVPGIYPGGEFSVSTWIYVTKWDQDANKIFFSLSGGGKGSDSYKTMVMYLGKKTNKLGIRISYTDPSATGTTTTLLKPDQVTNIINGISPYSDESSDFKKCDIEQVALQKWVSITAVMAGRTLDIYIDGKLSRSCVFDGMYMIDGDSPYVELGGLSKNGSSIPNPSGFGGLIGQTRVANFAYSPDQVYKNCLSGPFDNSLWSVMMSYMDPSQYSLDIKKNGETIVSGNTA